MEQNNSTPAFPHADPLKGTAYHYHGLTKREYFAAMAMQGLLAGSENEDAVVGNYTWYAEKSVQMSDALLKQLES